jgi:hypothetical protein
MLKKKKQHQGCRTPCGFVKLLGVHIIENLRAGQGERSQENGHRKTLLEEK